MVVVDASVIVKIFVDEPGSAEAVSLLRQGEALLVPAHAFAEAGEVVARKIRSGFVDLDQMSRIVDAFDRDFVVVPLAGLLDGAVRLSVETGASVYDCLYVVLAVSQNCSFVTADRRLVAKIGATSFAGLMIPLDSVSGSP